MYCTKCGTQIDGKFCYICGTKIDENEVDVKKEEISTTVGDNKASDKMKSDNSIDGKKAEAEENNESKVDKVNSEPKNAKVQNESKSNKVKNDSDTKIDSSKKEDDEDDLEGRAYLESKLQKAVDFFKKPKVLAIAIGVLLTIIIVSFLIILYKPSIKLDKYVHCKFNGYNAVGSAKVVYDYDAFEKEYKETIATHIDEEGLKKRIKQMIDASENTTDVDTEFLKFKEDCARALLRSIAGGVDKAEGLSNGDEVIYKWKIDDKFIDDCFDIKLKYDDEGIDFEVKGLSEVDTFNPFEGVELIYKGVAPEGRASFKFSSKILGQDYLNYSLSTSEGLDNADIVTATVTISGSPTNFVDEYGKVPYPNTMEFTVSGLGNLVKSMNDSTMLLEEVNKEASKRISDAMMAYLPGNQQVKEINYLGNVFLNKKIDSDGCDNICFMVYEMTISSSLKTEDEGWVKDENKVYTYVRFNDLVYSNDKTFKIDSGKIILPDNTFEVDSQYKDPDKWFGGKYELKFKGYEKSEMIYEDVIKDLFDDYDYEDNLNK